MSVKLKGWQPLRTCLFACAALLTFTSQHAFAQKRVKVTDEKVEAQCRDLPLRQRIRVTVARFNVTTPSSTSEFGANMATMLSNALQETGCFNVLSRLADKGDLEGELEFSQSKHADQSKAISDGKMLSAQLVITGEITEYNKNSKDVSYTVVKTGKETVKLGFIVQIKNPETREIYFSKSFNVTGKAGGKTNIGIGGIKLAGGNSSNPAEANALEQGIIEAMDFIASKRDVLANEVNNASSN